MRLANLVPPEAMPFTNITSKYFDSGDYPEALRRAAAAIDVGAVRGRQRAGERVGVGFSIFCEQGAHGTSVYAGGGIPMVPGTEQATARLTPDGSLKLRVGVQSHGQGLETTLAQIAHEELGVPVAQIELVHGDTALTPYSTGMGLALRGDGGRGVSAATARLAERVRTIASHLPQAPASDILPENGVARSRFGAAEVTLREIGRLWFTAPQNLPAGAEMTPLEATEGYKPRRDTGTFSYACHAALVSGDEEIGTVRLLDYEIVEDGGVLINPMVVDGQVLGGAAQGIGTAHYEKMPFDEAGQPMAATFADYLLPGAAEIPPIRILHMETPSPLTRFGQKGIGESGAIGPPAAIANAVNGALADLGDAVGELPITPEHVLAALARAKGAAQ